MYPTGGWRPWLPLLCLIGLLGATAAAYYPGLPGPFLFDDWASLPALGARGPVNNPVALVSYLTGGIAGPTGRPLALAAFLMDARDWPANPWSFKLTNLLFHLLNGVLLAALLARLSRLRGWGREAAAWVGILGAGLWLLHPLFVSTTLYVVQRMAELAALAVFAGLLAYITGRTRLTNGQTHGTYALMIGGLAGGTLLGTLAKENSLLLPLLALVLEWTVLRQCQSGGHLKPAPSGARWPHSCPQRETANARADNTAIISAARGCPPSGPSLMFRAAFLWLPSLALAACLVAPLLHLTRPIDTRGFTIADRLLTEPRVLVHYLYLLVIPHARSGGLFHEVKPSANPLSPWTTLPSLVLILALGALAFALRRRQPTLAAALLFYFAGHLIESTSIPLELYFEHRNYLPAALLFWPLASWFVRGREAAWLRAGTAGLALALLFVLTTLRADLWGNGVRLAQTWVRDDPGSARAIVWDARMLATAGRPGLALHELRVESRTQPADVSIALARLELACDLKAATSEDLAATVAAAERGRRGSRLIYQGVGRLAGRLEKSACPPFGAARLMAIPAAALANPHFAHYPALRQEFLVLQGRLLLREGRADAAFQVVERSLALGANPDTVLVAVAAFYLDDKPRLGLRLLGEYDGLPEAPPQWSMVGVHRWWLEHGGWYRESFHRLRAALGRELHRSSQ